MFIVFLVSILVLVFLVEVVAVSAEADVAYIYRRVTSIDNNVLDVFSDMGLSVDEINEGDLPLPNGNDFSDYKFIFVGDERFRNEYLIPVENYPTIISNYFFGEEWGLTNDGISKLTSNQPLSVRLINEGVEERVYTRASVGGKYLPYYYLDDANKCCKTTLGQVARTWAGEGNQFSNVGDVIAEIPSGIELENGKRNDGNICFFGIAKTDYWTSDARDMFKDCVGYVAVECYEDSDCPDNEVGGEYCANGDVVQNVEDFNCVNPGTVDSQCVDDVVPMLIEDCGENYCDAYGESYCKGGDVYHERTCYENGCLTGECFANFDTSEDLVQNCVYGCDGGECIESDCVDNDGDGFDSCSQEEPGDDGKEVDCDDGDSEVYPGAPEVCDGKDNDCDGLIDEGCIKECNDDVDNDGDDLIDEFDPGCWDDLSDPGSYDPLDDDESDGGIVCDNDLDCGTDGFVGDEFCNGPGGDDVWQDYKGYDCLNPSLGTSFCDSATEPRLVEVCADGCVDGDCVEIICEKDDDCDDADAYTKDTCVNPGTPESYCDYEDILCWEDGDCGIDGFLGDVYCDGPSDDDVWQNFRDWTCENPGSVSSSCSQVVSQELIIDCPDTCENGACIDIVCYTDDDCDDGKNETADYCNKPGTVESYCTHEGVICSEDRDCGSNRSIGGMYCYGDDIYREFMSFTCNFPGEFLSFCGNDIIEEKFFECQYACANGFCVRCNENLDCADEDIYTEDICWFSGTLDAYCSHEHIECFNNSECGEDSYVGLPYCMGDDIYQDWRVFDCVHEGETGSYCESETVPKFVEACDYGCANGYCTPGMHDVALIDFTKSFGGIFLEYASNGTDILDEIPVLICEDVIKAKVRVENQGDFYENVSFVAGFDGYVFSINPVDDLEPEDGVTKTSLSPYLVLPSTEGVYNVNVEAVIDFDDNPFNNFAQRQIEIICPECFESADCGEGSFELTCEGSNVTGVTVTPTCEGGECGEIVDSETVEDCGVDGCDDWGENYCVGDDVYENRTCYDGGCLDAECFSDSDSEERLVDECDDICVDGECVDVVCDKDSDCGKDGLRGDLFCRNNNVFQKYREWECVNPGTQDSSCEKSTSNQRQEICMRDYCNNWRADYCKNGDVYRYRNCFERGCEEGACFKIGPIVEEDKVRECEFGCSKGECKELPECNDGKDNDGDGKIDALVEDFSTVSGTKSWMKVPLVLRAFVNSKADLGEFEPLPVTGRGAALNLDSVTAKKVCELAGYKTVSYKNCRSSFDGGRCGWSSCGDNMIATWNPSRGEFDIRGACDKGNTWLSSLTCKNKYVITECNDGKDNDGDGKIDYPQDNGCESLHDISEKRHDPQCKNLDDLSE